jgi:LEA14-like dessication related protein
MKKKIAFLFLLFASIAYSQFYGPKISVKDSNHDFGDIVQGEKVQHNFVVTNTGGDKLVITNVRASCGCTAALPDKKELAPGESTNIKVEFNSTGRVGKQDKTVYVTSNDKENPEIQLKFKGNVVKKETANLKNNSGPLLEIPNTQYDFGKVTEGKVVDHIFTFKNNGDALLTIKEVKTSCGCTAALLSKKELAPGEEGTIKVELNTANRSGQMSRNVTIISNDTKEPQKYLTIHAEVLKEGSN